MPSIVFDHLNVFPEWFRVLLLSAWGLFLLAMPIYSLIKILQSQSVVSFVRSVPGFAKNLGTFLQHQIDDPIKFPKIERFMNYAMVVQSYLLSCTLFCYFTIIVLLWALSEKQLTLLQHFGVLGFSLLCAYMGAVLKTQGSRELLKLRGRQNA